MLPLWDPGSLSAQKQTELSLLERRKHTKLLMLLLFLTQTGESCPQPHAAEGRWDLGIRFTGYWNVCVYSNL